jgi:hypothetical protein
MAVSWGGHEKNKNSPGRADTINVLFANKNLPPEVNQAG